MDNQHMSFSYSSGNISDYISLGSFEELKDMRRGFVKFGYDNLYPQFVASLLEQSPIHKAIIDRKIQLVLGKSITIEGLPEEFLANNPKLIDEMKKALIDFIIFNTFDFQIINSNSGKLAQIEHIDVTKVRYGIKDENDEITKIFLCSNWIKPQKRKIYDYPVYSPDETDSIFSYSGYVPGKEYYTLPSYSGALAHILMDAEIAKLHLSNIEEGFYPSFHIKYNRYIDDPRERTKISRNLEDNFRGARKAGKVFITFRDKDDSNIELDPINSNDTSEKFSQLAENVQQNILSAHGVTSPMLFGIKTPGQLGGSSELYEAQSLFMKSFVKPLQTKFAEIVTELFKEGGHNIEFKFEDETLVSEKLAESTINQVLTINELRALAGYEPIVGGDMLLKSETIVTPPAV